MFSHNGLCVESSGADLGFYNPSERGTRGRGVGSGEGAVPRNFFCISCIKMVSFYAFPGIFIDTVIVNCYKRKLTLAFKLQKINMF